MTTFQEAESYILSIPRFGGKHSLKDTEGLLKRMGAAGIRGKIIHIAGTNGKGSVCAYLRSILLEGGRSVGMFISPHLQTMRERICLGTEMIPEQEFLRIFDRVRSAARQEQEAGGSHPSFFEFLFLMAMVYFEEKQPDYLILETGLGGRLDATNCLRRKDLCVITEIGYDHMQYLGNTISEIAAEKAGILRPGVPVVFVDKRTESTQVLTECAAKAQSPAIMIGKNNISDVNINHKTIDFSLYTGYYKYVNLSLSTAAPYQIENASLAAAAAQALSDERITQSVIREGLRLARWPGRMEEIRPGVYLDGAHNEDGIEAFLAAAENTCREGRRLLLFGVVRDKRYEEMIRRIVRSGLFSQIAVSVPDSERGLSLEREREIWEQCRAELCAEESGQADPAPENGQDGPKGFRAFTLGFYEDAHEAYEKLMAERGDEDVVYITGSLYLIGQMRTVVQKITTDGKQKIRGI